MKHIYVFSLLISLLIIPVIANAEPEGVLKNNEVGFSFYTGYSYGDNADTVRMLGANIIYHPVSFVAIEPGIFFWSPKEDEKNNMNNHTTTQERNEIGYEIGIYYYHTINNNLYLYIGPRFEYTKTSLDESNNYDQSKQKTESTGMAYYLPVGLKYMFNENIGIFGDFSLGYKSNEYKSKEWDSTGSLSSDTTTTTKTWSLMSTTLGVTFYL